MTLFYPFGNIACIHCKHWIEVFLSFWKYCKHWIEFFYPFGNIVNIGMAFFIFLETNMILLSEIVDSEAISLGAPPLVQVQVRPNIIRGPSAFCTPPVFYDFPEDLVLANTETEFFQL